MILTNNVIYDSYYSKIILAIETEWKTNQEINFKEDHTVVSQQYLSKLQILNKELRDTPNEYSAQYLKDVDELLKLEEANYKITLKMFIEKLACFDMIKKEEDDSVVIGKEKEIALLIQDKSKIREEINDLITTLKYQHK